MKKLCNWIVVFIPLFAQAQTDSLVMQQWGRDPVTNFKHTNGSQRQVITAEMIRYAGYTRLSEVLQLADAMTLTTTTGDRWRIQNGFGNYENQQCIIMVNGQRVELANRQGDINLLGIAPSEIDHIEILNAPGLYLGESTTNGLIHIITKKREQGFSAFVFSGSEVQPRPYRIVFGQRTETNGHYVYAQSNQAGVVYAKGNFFIETSGNFGFHNQQDPNPYTLHYQPGTRNSVYGGNIRSGFTTGKFIHQLQGFYHQQYQVGFATNQLIEAPPGANLSYTGMVQLAEGKQLRYDVATHQYNRFNTTGFSSSNNITHNLRYTQSNKKKHGALITSFGVAADQSSLAPYASLTIPVTRKTKWINDVQVTFTNQYQAPKLTTGIYKRISFISNYSLLLTYNQYGTREFSNVSVPGEAHQWAADFFYNLNIGNNVKFAYQSSLRGLAHETGYPIVELQTMQNAAILFKQQTNWVNRFNIHHDIIDNLTFDFNYLITSRIQTSNDLVNPVPKHRIQSIAYYQLPKKFTLFTRYYYQSKTSWLYPDQWIVTPAKQSAFFTLDFGIQKTLAKERIKLNLAARNVFNQQQQFEPYGATLPIRYTATISFHLSSLGKSPAKP